MSRGRALAGMCALTLCLAPRPATGGDLRGWFDLPVPGGAATLESLGIAPDERAMTLVILARALEDRDTRPGVTTAADRLLAQTEAPPGDGGNEASIPAPLDTAAWQAVLPPADDDLFSRIIRDRNALRLASGLTATDPSVREWLANDHDQLRFVYQNAAGAFSIAARSLRLAGNRFAVPGGTDADTIWESLVGESPAQPSAFFRALLTRYEGRLAWYFDTIAGLDDDRLAAAWPDTPAKRNTAAALFQAFRADPQWRIEEHPFRRMIADAWTVLTQVDVSGGAPVSPLSQYVWGLLFSERPVNPELAAGALAGRRPPPTLTWLTREIVLSASAERRFRFELFRLAQRVFANTSGAALADVVLALDGYRAYPALLLTLERMNVSDPAAWAAAVAAARHVTGRADDVRNAVPAFQGALALVERMRHVRTLDVPAATTLVRSLSDGVREDSRVTRSVARWIAESLLPALPRLVRPDAWTGRTAMESTVLQSLAGPVEHQTTPLEWEGLPYVVDVIATEHERLRAMRTLVPSPGLDAAVLSEDSGALADALIALVYVTALGDPAGPASLGPDVSTRHDFGFSGTVAARASVPWNPPEERQGLGIWRVQGALMGLDLALSRLVLHRVADQQMPGAPTLTLNDLATLTRTPVLMVPTELRDDTRDELAAAIARGRERVAAAGDIDDVLALARECGLSAAARQMLPWLAARQPEAIPAMFSLRDLLWLGKPALPAAEIDRWGVSAEAIDRHRGTRMPAPVPWDDFAGRAEAGQVATQAPDLTLRLVEETARLRLPALLVPSLLGFALGDYWHGVQSRFDGDWLELTRQARLLSSSRIEDYVAALTGAGPLRSP